jgi:hypothetical protein
MKSPLYFSDGDEDAFFAWLEHFGCLDPVRGEGDTLHVLLKDRAAGCAGVG